MAARKPQPSKKTASKPARPSPAPSKSASPAAKKGKSPAKAAPKKSGVSAGSKPAGKKAPAKKAAAVQKAPVKKTAAVKASPAKPSVKPAAVKNPKAVKSRPAPAAEAPATVVNTLSAAARRIQDRDRKRKQKTSDRLSLRSHSGKNGHIPELNSRSVKAKPLTAKELERFKKLLLEFRDRIVGDITFLTADNLHRMGRETGADLSGASQHSADHGTDNFDREFALSLATTEQDVLYEIDEALQRIEEGTYGICEMSGVNIDKGRLEVIPYTRYSVQAQARMEQGRARYRPFSQTFRGW